MAAGPPIILAEALVQPRVTSHVELTHFQRGSRGSGSQRSTGWLSPSNTGSVEPDDREGGPGDCQRLSNDVRIPPS